MGLLVQDARDCLLSCVARSVFSWEGSVRQRGVSRDCSGPGVCVTEAGHVSTILSSVSYVYSLHEYFCVCTQLVVLWCRGGPSQVDQTMTTFLYFEEH